jgi:hypothetical protein
MNTRLVNSAAGVVQAAMEQGRQTAAGIALALDAAQLLMSPEVAAELERLRAERHSTNESVSEADEALRANRDRIAELETTNDALRARLAVLEAQRAALAERLLAGQQWRRGRNPELVSEDRVSQPELRVIFGIPLAAPWDGVAEADGITRRIAPTQALREEPPLKGRARLDELTVERAEATHWKRLGLEDQHDSPLHRTDRIPHDLEYTPNTVAHVVAYRDPHRPQTLLCREHGPRYIGMFPVTAEDLPDGGMCTYGGLSSLACGRDVLADGAELGGSR